ncbi:MAG: hypothetical protein ACK521_01070 [bacterium]
MFSQYHSYLFDDRTLSSSAAIRKRAIESDASKPKAIVVNTKRVNLVQRNPAEFDRLCE